MKVNLHTPVEEVQIQIVPLIDVIFCILTFFLLAALQFTRQQAINLDLPKSNIGTETGINKIVVDMDAVGRISVNNNSINREDLALRVKQYLEANPSGVLVLNASRTSSYNDVIETLGFLRDVAGNRVSLGIIPGPAQLPTNSPDSTAPSLPINPGTPPIPNTAPVPGSNLQGNPNSYFPSDPNQIPATGQDLSPVNPAAIPPVVPNANAPQAPVAPGKTQR
ncbi:biopolymer transport protein ExbD/TolR [Cylindrospermum sp. NIES-4074]|nr:biopolymer transport protein ExbD/TolR [Cylindrospermum sp. NIES-4074]